jgi:dCTP deaminase
MILTDTRILEEMEKGTIVISPFDRGSLGSNSYDVHLGRYLAVYCDDILDAREHNKVDHFEISPDGLILLPHRFYLGVTGEYTETHRHVPFLEGKSSIGRLGIDIHATAGKGDVGFCNTWTLEISVRQPVRVYPGMPIGQLIYFEISGEIGIPYGQKRSAKYTTRTDRPVESMMWKNFAPKDGIGV